MWSLSWNVDFRSPRRNGIRSCRRRCRSRILGCCHRTVESVSSEPERCGRSSRTAGQNTEHEVCIRGPRRRISQHQTTTISVGLMWRKDLLWICVYGMGRMLIEHSAAYLPCRLHRLSWFEPLCARRLQRRGPFLIVQSSSRVKTNLRADAPWRGFRVFTSSGSSRIVGAIISHCKSGTAKHERIE